MYGGQGRRVGEWERLRDVGFWYQLEEFWAEVEHSCEVLQWIHTHNDAGICTCTIVISTKRVHQIWPF